MNTKDRFRFWSYVKVGLTTLECWEWKGAKNKFGYGWFACQNLNVRTASSAHRYMFKQIYPETNIKGLLICHACNNALCVNPAHLYAGTYLNNNWDRLKTGKHNLRLRSRLTDQQIDAIREAFANGATVKELCLRYGLSDNPMRNLLRGWWRKGENIFPGYVTEKSKGTLHADINEVAPKIWRFTRLPTCIRSNVPGIFRERGN